MSSESTNSTVDVLTQMAEDFHRRDLAHHITDIGPHNGRTISLRSRELVNFGSCSYLGLETHPALKEGVIDAVQQYGTQFSSSRAFISVALYDPLEECLRQMFDKPVIATATTTLGHIAALPVLVDDRDAVILDLQVHHSVQTAAQLLKARGIPLHIIRHNDMDQLEQKIQGLRSKHRKIWYLADGVYSMFGDYAPMDTLTQLMDTYESFHLYIDDAHGMSWAGKHGTGYVRSHSPHHPKMVLAVSLNKAFASSGGALVLPDEKTEATIRNCGGTMIFSGPIQPPMLGAAIASAKLHLSPEIDTYQAELHHLVEHTNHRLDDYGLPQYQVTPSPLYFIPMGLPRIVANMVHRMIDDGFYVNMATFPATPMRQCGLRFMVNRNLGTDDIDAMLERVHHHYPLALKEEGSSVQEVARAFQMPEFKVRGQDDAADRDLDAPRLSLEQFDSIDSIDEAEWDSHFAPRGNLNHRGLQMLESVFKEEESPENHCDFSYVLIRDEQNHVVLATFFTTATVKDDMFSEAPISRQIESLRRDDPFYLTSKAVMLGCPISKGEHLFLDREHPQWQQAMRLLLNAMQETREKARANQLMLREFFTGEDGELRQFMLDQGFVEFPLGNTCQVRDMNWTSPEDFQARLGQKYRYSLRKEILRFEDRFELVTESPWTPQEIRDCYELYENVHDRAFQLNVFKLPYRFFEEMCAHPDYEVLRLYLLADPRPPMERKPVAVMFSSVQTDVYSALIVGLDYDYVRSHNTYKQILHRTVQRARDLECRLLDLAYTAEMEKKKVGAQPHPTCAYVQSDNHYNHSIIESMTLEGTYS